MNSKKTRDTHELLVFLLGGQLFSILMVYGFCGNALG